MNTKMNVLENYNKKKLYTYFKNKLLIIFLFLLVFIVSIVSENFFTIANFNNIFSNVTPRFIIALGVSATLISGGTDLSAGRAVGLAGIIASSLLQRRDFAYAMFPDWPEYNIVAVFLIVIIILSIVGAINGICVAFLKVPAFLSSLGIQTILYGIACIYSNASPIGGLRRDYTDIAITSSIKIGNLHFKILFLFPIVAGIIFWFLYNKTRFGKYMYAIGGNENAAIVSGVNVKINKILIYTLAGAMYAISGFLLAAKAGGASVNLGYGYELEAIAACTIGGISTTGGVGKVTSVLLGVLVFELLKSSMQFLGINSYYQQIIQGIVIIIAVAFDMRKYITKK